MFAYESSIDDNTGTVTEVTSDSTLNPRPISPNSIQFQFHPILSNSIQFLLKEDHSHIFPFFKNLSEGRAMLRYFFTTPGSGSSRRGADEDCAQHLMPRVEKTWRQLYSQCPWLPIGGRTGTTNWETDWEKWWYQPWSTKVKPPTSDWSPKNGRYPFGKLWMVVI